MHFARRVRTVAGLIALFSTLMTAPIVAAASPGALLYAEESGLILPGWVGWLGVLLAVVLPLAAWVWYRSANDD